MTIKDGPQATESARPIGTRTKCDDNACDTWPQVPGDDKANAIEDSQRVQ